jgi:hypothetical protein
MAVGTKKQIAGRVSISADCESETVAQRLIYRRDDPGSSRHPPLNQCADSAHEPKFTFQNRTIKSMFKRTRKEQGVFFLAIFHKTVETG